MNQNTKYVLPFILIYNYDKYRLSLEDVNSLIGFKLQRQLSVSR